MGSGQIVDTEKEIRESHLWEKNTQTNGYIMTTTRTWKLKRQNLFEAKTGMIDPGMYDQSYKKWLVVTYLIKQINIVGKQKQRFFAL